MDKTTKQKVMTGFAWLLAITGILMLLAFVAFCYIMMMDPLAP